MRVPNHRIGSSGRSALGAAALGCVAALVLGGTNLGCALLVPPVWRTRAPVPLAGPIEAELSSTPTGTPAAIVAAITADRRELVAIVSEPMQDPSDRESAEARASGLREIAIRLPALQEELRAAGGEQPGQRIRHPVIR